MLEKGNTECLTDLFRGPWSLVRRQWHVESRDY